MNANHTGCSCFGFSTHHWGFCFPAPYFLFNFYTMAIAAEMDKRAKSAHFFGAV
jgi:hypothetical protein